MTKELNTNASHLQNVEIVTNKSESGKKVCLEKCKIIKNFIFHRIGLMTL
jgi:hypothetical protein